MRMLRLVAALALLASPAIAQTGTVTNHAFAVGKGPGVTGFTSLLCTSAQLAVGQAAADPICRTVTGDVTIDASGVTAIGASKVLNAQLATMAANTTKCNATAGTANPTDCTAATMRTNLALVPGTNVEAWDADLDALAALAGTGIARRTASNTWSVGTAVTNAELATMATNTLKGNATAGTATPTDLAVPSCSSVSSALTWTTSTGFGCNSIAAGGSGAWSNTRLAKTAAYATVTGDCGVTLALGGTAFYAATFNAPSGYAATCAFVVSNEDTTRGKLIIPQFASSATSTTIATGSKAFTTASGLNVIVGGQRYRVYSLANPANFMSGVVASYATTTFTLTVDTIGGSGTFTDWQIAPEYMLWPQQSRMIFAQNNVWSLEPPSRWKTPSVATFHVDNTNGSNANDGLGSTTGAVKDAQRAWTYAAYQIDTPGSTPIIAMACSQTHTVALSMGGTPLGTNLVQLSPDGNCSFTWTNSGPCIAIADLAELDLNLNFYGSSGAATFGCNTSNSTMTGAILLHNDVVLDLEGTPAWNPAGSNDNFLFCDGMCQFTVANGITQATAAAGNYIVNMSAGGHGTLSGVISAPGSGAANGVFYMFGGATLALGSPSGGIGWASLGTSKVYGNSTLINNSISTPGGVSVGATGANCASLTSSC